MGGSVRKLTKQIAASSLVYLVVDGLQSVSRDSNNKGLEAALNDQKKFPS